MNFCTLLSLTFPALLLVFPFDSPAQNASTAKNYIRSEAELKSPSDYLLLFAPPGSDKTGDANSGKPNASVQTAQVSQNQTVGQPKDFQFAARQTETFEVELTWMDSGEDLAESFVVLRRVGQGEWHTLGGLRALNSDNAPDIYVLRDPNPPAGQVQYLLQRIGFDDEVRNGLPLVVEVSKF